MATYAVIENNLVINTIVAESIQDAELLTQKTCVEIDPNDPKIVSNLTQWDGNNFNLPEN